MSLKFTVGDLTIHRVIEQETTFLPALEMLPGLTPELLSENRSWMQQAGGLDAQDVLILDNGDVILDSYVITEYLDELAGGGKLVPASGVIRWKVKSDHSMLQGMLDSMLLCRYEKMVRREPQRWQAWADDHWARAWNGMARFEKQAEMLARPQLDIAQIGLVCVLGYADFRFADCGWRKAFPNLDAFHARMLERPSVKISVPPPA